jgi:hypothetical protein
MLMVHKLLRSHTLTEVTRKIGEEARIFREALADL